MPSAPVLIRLSWDDPEHGTPKNAVLQAPVAIGREIDQMPTQLGGQPISHLELAHKQVSRYHALITVINQQLQITDKSANGTFVNGRVVQTDGQAFSIKDTLRVGPFKITVDRINDRETNATELNMDRSYVTRSASGATPNSVAIWIVGGIVLVLLSLGMWAIARLLIEQARPNIDSESTRLK
ncbi:MAG: FHA domain-containing protein, partial [Merismopedia sp. SIO2A8]|nr:FHA domain-containing protein [Merismopedia sp. SIO2A8]